MKKFQDPNNPKRWCGQEVVTKNQCAELVFPLADTLSIDEEQALELIDIYFTTDSKTQN